MEEGGRRVRKGDETADTEVKDVTAGREDRKGREPRKAGASGSWKWPGNTFPQSPQEEGSPVNAPTSSPARPVLDFRPAEL